MKSLHADYLLALEVMAECSDIKDLLLWPRTPIGDQIQEKIVKRAGASDYEVKNPQSRSARIIRFIGTMVNQRLLPADLSVLDIACGDAIVIWQLKRAFNQARCYGIDCNKGNFPSHDKVRRDGVRLYRGFIQHLLQKDVGEPFDLVIMLNTYRGWESAELREHEQDLPQQVDAWLQKNARYTILTVTKAQMAGLRALGFRVLNMGRGEDSSRMVCVSKHTLPMPWWHSAMRRWASAVGKKRKFCSKRRDVGM